MRSFESDKWKVYCILPVGISIGSGFKNEINRCKIKLWWMRELLLSPPPTFCNKIRRRELSNLISVYIVAFAAHSNRFLHTPFAFAPDFSQLVLPSIVRTLCRLKLKVNKAFSGKAQNVKSWQLAFIKTWWAFHFVFRVENTVDESVTLFKRTWSFTARWSCREWPERQLSWEVCGFCFEAGGAIAFQTTRKIKLR